MTFILLSIMAIGIISGFCALAISIYRVISEQFEELLPNRMVDYAGFIEPQK